MNKHISSVIPAYLLRPAFCAVTAILLAAAGPIVGQNKTARADRVSGLMNVDLSLGARAPDVAGELVINGGFETGNFTGWNVATSNAGVDMPSAHSGTYGAFFNPVGAVGFIFGGAGTTAFALYDLTFWLANDGGTPNHFEVSWGGAVLDSANNAPAMPYTRFTYAGLQGSNGPPGSPLVASTHVDFGFRNDALKWHLDDVSVRLHVVRAAPDFNGDNFPDLVLFNSSTRQTAIWYLNDGSFTGSMFGPNIPADWKIIDVADFDGDGNVDLALFNATTRQTVIWYFVGASFSSSAFGPTLPAGWILVSTGEFNGDVHPDFVLFNAATRKIVVWFLNNNMFIGSAFGPPAVFNGWRGVGGGNFDGDGQLDYVFFNPTTRQTAIWYLIGTRLHNHEFGLTLPAGWELIGVADFNIDGSPDYLLFNAAMRRTAIWHLNNNSLVSSAFGPIIPPGWDIAVP